MAYIRAAADGGVTECITRQNDLVVIQIAEGLQLPQLAASVDGQEVVGQATKKGGCMAAAHSNDTASFLASQGIHHRGLEQQNREQCTDQVQLLHD